jgi:cytochrome c oxidase accessory protein FixG
MTTQAQTSDKPQIEEISLYEKRENIYQKEVSGRFQNGRAVTLLLLAGVFLAGPWWRYGDRQAIWLDLPARRFHFFGITFWPQDFILLSWLLITAAFGLFFFTNLAGRLWCGYGCPQTVWTKFFMWIEWLTEGDRNQRILLDRAPWSVRKVGRKAAKHASWVALSLAVGVTFVGYFSPIRELLVSAARFDLGGTQAVAVGLLSAALYLDAGWMREQICKYACPYARFQGAMFDSSTLTIFYDRTRGEPRGHRRPSAAATKNGLGDCVDCGACVHVCPTGIDIRKGTQYECIGCAACIDACDEIMDKMGYARGLVRYATEKSLAGKPVRIFRPRLVAYGAVFLTMLSGLTYALANRVPLELDILRERNRLYRETSDGAIENLYRLRILNMDQKLHRYAIAASGIEALVYEGDPEVDVAPGEIRDVPVRLQAPARVLRDESTEIRFEIRTTDGSDLSVQEESRFLAPVRGER